jgi:hypothetical protein
MKKVKVMLSALVVLAVVGGALAFKAEKFTSTTLFKKGANGCTIQANVKTAASGLNTVSASIVNGGTCTTYTIVDVE